MARHDMVCQKNFNLKSITSKLVKKKLYIYKGKTYKHEYIFLLHEIIIWHGFPNFISGENKATNSRTDLTFA